MNLDKPKTYFETDEDKYAEAERWIPLIKSLFPINREFAISDLYDRLPYDFEEQKKLHQVDIELTKLLVKTGEFRYSRGSASIYHIETTALYKPSIPKNKANGITLITPQLKDAVLLFLCENCLPEKHINFHPSEATSFMEIDFDTLSAILTQFQRKGLLCDLNVRQDIIYLTLRVDAQDHLNRFGFFALEEIFKANLEKLGHEVDSLNNDTTPEKRLEKITKISNITGTLIAGLALFKPN
jgi:hypothetical protein